MHWLTGHCATSSLWSFTVLHCVTKGLMINYYCWTCLERTTCIEQTLVRVPRCPLNTGFTVIEIFTLSQDSSNTGFGENWCAALNYHAKLDLRLMFTFDACSCCPRCGNRERVHTASVSSLLSLLNFLRGTNAINGDTPTYSLFDFP